MKTKIATLFSLVILMACGSGNQTAPAEQGTEVKAAIPKFIIKASNNQYLSINPDKSLLTANQPNAALAETFEIIDQGNGKIALRVSTGKYVCADQSKNFNVVADRDYAGAWETFEMIRLDQSKVNFKAFTGKYVCADQGAGGVLMANRDGAADWETFVVEPK